MHEGNNNEGVDDDKRKIVDKYIPEEDVNRPQLLSPTEWRVYNLSTIKPSKYSKHPGVDDYAHAQMVHYAMTQYLLRKILMNLIRL